MRSMSERACRPADSMEARDWRTSSGLDSKTRCAPPAWITIKVQSVAYHVVKFSSDSRALVGHGLPGAHVSVTFEPGGTLARGFCLLSAGPDVGAQKPARGPRGACGSDLADAEILSVRGKENRKRGGHDQRGDDPPSAISQGRSTVQGDQRAECARLHHLVAQGSVHVDSGVDHDQGAKGSDPAHGQRQGLEKHQRRPKEVVVTEFVVTVDPANDDHESGHGESQRHQRVDRMRVYGTDAPEEISGQFHRAGPPRSGGLHGP